jgi:hydrogenase-1 operon protein HyaF
MSHLQDIPVTVLQAGADAAPNGRALLVELESLLRVLVEEGREGSIDLRSLPLSPGDLAFLERHLGRGEVAAEVSALGPSRVQETAIHGVWWVRHYNDNDEVMAEFLEITHCPDIIRAHPADVRDSLEELRARLVELE